MGNMPLIYLSGKQSQVHLFWDSCDKPLNLVEKFACGTVYTPSSLWVSMYLYHIFRNLVLKTVTNIVLTIAIEYRLLSIDEDSFKN